MMTERSSWRAPVSSRPAYSCVSTHSIMGQAMTGKPGMKCTAPPPGPLQLKPGIWL